MIRQIRLDILLLVIITAAVTVLVLNATSGYSPFGRGTVGIPAESVVLWGQGAEAGSRPEATPEPDAVGEAVPQPETAAEQPAEEATVEG